MYVKCNKLYYMHPCFEYAIRKANIIINYTTKYNNMNNNITMVYLNI